MARTVIAGMLIAVATVDVFGRGSSSFLSCSAYLAWRRVGWRAVLAFTVAVAIPLLGYAALEDADFGTFGLSQWTGWTAYARVAGFADCAGAGIAPAARPLCETAAQRAAHTSASIWYLFDGASPAIKLYGPISRSVATQRHSDAVLRDFALRVALHQPLDTLSAVSLDFLRFFAPGTAQAGDSTGATILPDNPSAEYMDRYVLDRFVPTVRPTVRSPSPFLRGYRSVIHLPRPLLAIFAIASLAAVALRLPARREILLLSGTGLILLAGTAATAGFAQRYVLCAVPPLTIGGALALRDITHQRRTHKPGH